MPQVWIVHRRERERAALVRLVDEADVVAGTPADLRFEEAPPAEVVVLGLADDWEAELEFAHRQRGRLGAARWILVGEASAADAARALFDQLSLDYMAYPPPGPALRQLLERARGEARPSLSQRALRDSVAGRFSRWLADLELPELMRALDPRLAEVPLRVGGEPGTGRGALIRYAHQFGGTSAGRLVHLACDAETDLDSIRAALDRRGLFQSPEPALCIWLDELARLAPRHQRELAEWLEPGGAALRTPTLRWVASVDSRDPELEPELARQLGTLSLQLPPLRERGDHLEPFAAETAAWWARARREARRRFDAGALAALKEYPWPGNLRELETVLLRSLAASSRETLGADDLRIEGAPASRGSDDEPLDIASVGTLLPDEPQAPEAAAAVAPARPSEGERPAKTPDTRLGPPAETLDTGLRPLADALAQHVRSPLATLRSFAELMPEHFGNPRFRERFTAMLREDASGGDGLLARLDRLAPLDAPQRDKLNLAGLLEALLERRREHFRRRHLLVLKELDASQPLALADPEHVQLAFEAVLDKAVELVSERGDLYLASRRLEAEGEAEPRTRVLLRFHDPDARVRRGTSAAEHSLGFLVAELLVRAQGGSLTLSASEAEERVLVIDLPSP